MIQTGAELIAAERIRQFEEEEWNDAEDAEHSEGQLADAARCYANPSVQVTTDPPDIWPFDNDWWKPKGTIKNLIRAGALIAAEIDRLQKKEEEEAHFVAERIHPGLWVIQHSGHDSEEWNLWSPVTWMIPAEANDARAELAERHKTILRFRIRRFIPDPEEVTD